MQTSTRVIETPTDAEHGLGPAHQSMASQPQAARLTITLFASMAPLEPEWRTLERDNLTSLHQSYSWCQAWAAVYRPRLAVLRGCYGSDTAFILPLEIVRRHGVRIARFIGAPRSNINTGLFSPQFLQRAEGLSAEMRTGLVSALDGHADLLLLENLPLQWRGRASPLASLPFVENQNRAFQLPLLGAFEATLSQLSAKRRRKKHRQQTRMLNEMGGFEHVVAATPDEKRQMLALFLQQKAERFRAAGLPDVFQGTEAHDFLLRLLETDSASPDDRPLVLHGLRLKGRHEGHMPALAGLSRKGDHVICQFASIDESVVPEASPGELLFWMMIESCHGAGVALFDFGIGDQLYKRSWCPVQTVQHDVVLPISARGQIVAVAQKGLTRLKARIKGNPRLYGFIQGLRARRHQAPAQAVDEA